MQPTPDYGTLGPNSDIRAGAPIRPQGRSMAWLAVLAGVLLGLATLKVGSLQETWQHALDFLATAMQPRPRSTSSYRSSRSTAMQQQADAALQAAMGHQPGANERIAEQADGWRGHIVFNQELRTRLTVALNSDDLAVRESAIEVELAAYNVAKTPEAVDLMVRNADSRDQATHIWALWTLGLLGNRGVETERVVAVLAGHLKDNDIESRHWAVEGLALVGTDATIEPLLRAFHDDPAVMVRERAACSLAQSGMLRPEQRRTVIPQILNYTDDPKLDNATHMFAFHALRDITGQNLPNDAAAWREWYGRQ